MIDDDEKVFARYLKLCRDGVLSPSEVIGEFAWIAWRNPNERDEILRRIRDTLDESTIEAIQDCLQSWKECEESKDLHQLRRVSPLRPGVWLKLYGGYFAYCQPPTWLNGREYYRARFLDFVQGQSRGVPVAHIEFEGEVDTGQIKTQQAMLRLSFVGTWKETGTVIVYLIESLPPDTDEFCNLDPLPYYKAIETHATYELLTDESSPE